MVEKDHGVELDSAKVSALMVVPMMDFAYQLQTLAFPRWVYSGEAKKHEVYGRPAADTWVGWREPGDSLFCPCLTDSSRARVCTSRLYTPCLYTLCPSRAGLSFVLPPPVSLLPGSCQTHLPVPSRIIHRSIYGWLPFTGLGQVYGKPKPVVSWSDHRKAGR